MTAQVRVAVSTRPQGQRHGEDQWTPGEYKLQKLGTWELSETAFRRMLTLILSQIGHPCQADVVWATQV